MDRCAIVLQILELSETSYMPELSTYYGVVLSLDSSPSGSSSIRLKLHPSCRASALALAVTTGRGDGWDKDEGAYEYRDEGADVGPYGAADGEYAGGRRKFGEDMLLGEDGHDDAVPSQGPDDEKEISLDEIVDCRRLSLRVALQR